MDKVHRPNIVGLTRDLAIAAKLGFDTPLGRFLAQLQPLLTIEAAHALGIDERSLRDPVCMGRIRLRWSEKRRNGLERERLQAC